MKTRSTIPMWVAKSGYIVMSLVFCAAGTACIANPGLSATVIGRVLGAAMILFGAVKLVGYCSRDLYRLAFQYDLGFGLLLIALGNAAGSILISLCLRCGSTLFLWM